MLHCATVLIAAGILVLDCVLRKRKHDFTSELERSVSSILVRRYNYNFHFSLLRKLI